MSAERPTQAKDCFLAALELDDSQRDEYLARLREQSVALAEEVSAMLAFDRGSTGFLDGPPARGAPTPESIGPFRVLRVIGAGGMGIVYEAEQERPRRRVALKVLESSGFAPNFGRRFEYEGELLARLSHAGIAQVFETGAIDGPLGSRRYIAMEFVDGVPLTQHARERNLDRSARIELVARVADAVEHAHRRGVIHRDLKPANILVTADGQPKVLDFGIGRSLDAADARRTLATEAGQILGTLQYMSPEQALGAVDDIDTRADVYALGVLLYELLVDDLPYVTNGKPLHEALQAVITAEPVRLATIERSLEGDLETIVAKTLEKQPEARYGSAGALAEDLRRHLADEPILAQPATRMYRLKKYVRRHRALVGGFVATLAALLLGLAGTSWQAVVAREQSRQAREAAETSREILQRLLLDGIATMDPRELGPAVTAANVFTHVEQQLDGAFDGRPLVEASVRDALGTIWRALGNPERAEPVLVRALELRREHLGDDHVQTLETMEHLAACQFDLARLDETLALCESVFARRCAVLGENNRDTLRALSVLAATLWAVGRTNEAIERMREAVERQTQHLGATDDQTLASMNNLAVYLGLIGEPQEAQSLYEQVLAAARSKHGEEHPDVLANRANLADFLEQQGQLEGAEGTWRELLAAFERTFGRQHPTTAGPMLSLANALAREKGHEEEAEQLLRRALALLSRSLGDAHRDVLGATIELVHFLERHSKADEAVTLMRQAMVAQRSAFPDGHPDTVLALNSLGQSLRRAGHADEARAAFEEGIAMARRISGVPPNTLSQCLLDLGVLLRVDLRSPGDAAPLLAEALEIDGRILRVGHDSLGVDRFHLGSALLEAGRPAEAEPVLRSLLEAPFAPGPDDPRAPNRLRALGNCLVTLGRFDEAIELLTQAVERAERILGPDDKRTHEARDSLALARENAAAR